MPATVRTLMLKEGLPTVAEARSKLTTEIDQAQRSDVVAIKIIHGYGSTGVGGALKDAIRASLRKRRKEGKIQAFVTGEKWDAFDETSRAILDACPDLQHDPDLGRYNEGITIVLL
jgi:hypothetical protein